MGLKFLFKAGRASLLALSLLAVSIPLPSTQASPLGAPGMDVFEEFSSRLSQLQIEVDYISPQQTSKSATSAKDMVQHSNKYLKQLLSHDRDGSDSRVASLSLRIHAYTEALEISLGDLEASNPAQLHKVLRHTRNEALKACKEFSDSMSCHKELQKTLREAQAAFASARTLNLVHRDQLKKTHLLVAFEPVQENREMLDHYLSKRWNKEFNTHRRPESPGEYIKSLFSDTWAKIAMFKRSLEILIGCPILSSGALLHDVAANIRKELESIDRMDQLLLDIHRILAQAIDLLEDGLSEEKLRPAKISIYDALYKISPADEYQTREL